MVIGVLTFPAGWDVSVVRDVCGPDAGDYDPGQCGIRWAYILAVIGVADCVVLAALAFVLGTRYVKLLPDQYISNGSVYKGEPGACNGHSRLLAGHMTARWLSTQLRSFVWWRVRCRCVPS